MDKYFPCMYINICYSVLNTTIEALHQRLLAMDKGLKLDTSVQYYLQKLNDNKENVHRSKMLCSESALLFYLPHYMGSLK